MSSRVILASASASRAQMLTAAGLSFEALPARVDEETIRASYAAEAVSPRDQADGLAEVKAAKIAAKHPDAWVIGSDQVLSFEGEVWSKPETPEALFSDLLRLRGKTHELYSAAVVYEAGRPVWRHIGRVRLTMRAFTEDYLQDYINRNWDDVRDAVGGYHLEAEGVRLFQRIDGDYFTVLGMPLVELLAYLASRGVVRA